MAPYSALSSTIATVDFSAFDGYGCTLRVEHRVNMDERLYKAIEVRYRRIDGEDLLERLEHIVEDACTYTINIKENMSLKAEAVKFRNKHEDILNDKNKFRLDLIRKISNDTLHIQ